MSEKVIEPEYDFKKADFLWLLSVAYHGLRLNSLREQKLRMEIEGWVKGLPTPQTDEYMAELERIAKEYDCEQNLKNIVEGWTYEG